MLKKELQWQDQIISKWFSQWEGQNETVAKAGKVVIIAAGIGWGWEHPQELMQINRCVARPQMKELHKNFITRPVFQATSRFVLNSQVLITY